MEPLTENAVRASFVNCSKGEARRLPVPRNLDDLPWPDLDFLGWRPPGAPDRGYLVAERRGAAGGLVGLSLRVPPASRTSLLRSTVCSVCLTPHVASGVTLLAARRAGAAGRQGNTVGIYMCADLSCPLYVRGRKKPEVVGRYEETLSVDEQVERMLGNLDGFLADVEKAPAG